MKTVRERLVRVLRTALAAVPLVLSQVGCKKAGSDGGEAAASASASVPPPSSVAASDPPEPGASSDPVEPFSPDDEHESAVRDISKHNAKAELDALERELK